MNNARTGWRRPITRLLSVLIVLAMMLPTSVMAARPPEATGMLASQPLLANALRISQVYGGGGGTGYYLYDYIELFNAGTAAVDIGGWSLQYGSATGNFASYAGNLYVIPTGTTIGPGKYLLVQLSTPGSSGNPLPVTPDLTTANLTMSQSNGKAALANISTALGCGATATPCALPHPNIVDLAAWGTSNNAEGGVTINNGGSLTNQDGGVRKLEGCQDTDNNGNDFDVVSGASLIPRNSSSPTHSCGGGGGPSVSVVKTATPATDVAVGDHVTYTIVLTNSGTASDTNLYFTDTLPAEVDLAYWVTEPTGTSDTGDEITWSGTLTNNTALTFTFAVTNNAGINSTVVNTAEFSGTSQANTDSASYSTLPTLQVQSTVPTNDAVNVSVDTDVRATFNTAVSPTTVNTTTFTVEGPGGAVTGAVGYDNPTHTATFTPGAALAPLTRYTATLTTGIYDMSGNPLGSPYTWSFKTSTASGLTPIYEIQHTTDPGSGSPPTYPSPYATQKVTTTGTICVYLSEGYIIADAPGPWHSLYLYVGNSTKPPVGSKVQATDIVDEYYGMTELSFPSVSPASAGDPACAPTLVTAAEAPYNVPSLSEQYESVIVEYRDITITALDIDGALFTDASGATGAIGKEGYILPGIAVGQRYEYVRGPLYYTYDTYRVMPPTAGDIRLLDLTPPTVTLTIPSGGATGVSPYKPIYATFSEAISPTTVSTATFLLNGPDGSITGSVTYNPGAFQAKFVPSAALATNSIHTATLTTGIRDLYGNALAAPFTWSFTTGSEDTTPPSILAHYPASGAISVPISSAVVITFSEELDPATVIPANFGLTGPYGTVPATLAYNSVTSVAVIEPSSNLLPTSLYTVTIKAAVADWAGLPLGADAVWSFQTAVEPPMYAYHGDIHNHTEYSDGSGTPAQALAAGQAAGFDFMAITDHSYAINDTEWNDISATVTAATVPGQFVALRGFEYTQGAEGHINVYNTVRHACRTNTGYSYCDYTPNLEKGVTVDGFYHWLSITGTQAIDGDGTLAQFNHPGWINFNDWAFHPEVSPTARLEEVGNGNGTSYAFSEDEYIRSLDYGWKVGATNNADTHTLYWGVNTDHRTGVWMPDLTKSDLLEALRERRTFATEDKDYVIGMKANGAWMGSEIPNTGQIAFEIFGSDPDGEANALVQLITDQGMVVTQTVPGASSFTWNVVLDITPGVHYYYVKATQPDGDRIVSSPVWTQGAEDISITDVVIQPTIPTIFNPSLLTARVTNRASSTRTVTVTMDVNGAALVPSVVVDVPPYNDAYANFTWQPAATGVATVTATMTGAPAGDNPDDNSGQLILDVTDQHLPLILIDAGHGNTVALGREMRMFIKDLSDHKYNVLKNLDALTASDLNTNTVKLLMITAPETAYTNDELDAIANYVAGGGSLWLCGLADYTGKVWWADTTSDRLNAILDRIETRIGSQINMRMNDDEVVDYDDNNGYVFGVYWRDFPSVSTTSIGVNVKKITSWSLNSIRGRTLSDPLTSSTPGVQIVVQGDLDPGYGPPTWYDPMHTANEDADGQGDAYIYNPTWTHALHPDPNYVPTDAIPVPMAAATQLPGDGGRILLYGDSNDAFTTFAYTAGDGLQNELFNLETVMWLLGEPLQKSTVAQARYDPELNNTPDNLDKLVWVEGKITSGFGEFFNVLYVQDDTGGITIHAPAGDISATQYARGAYVRAVGTVGIYNGDTEIEFFEAEQVQVITPTNHIEPAPRPMSTYSASLEVNEGWLVQVTGAVTSKIGLDNIFVDDGSGPVRAFLDGYNGDFSDVVVGGIVSVKGMASEDGDGHRIRVRNRQAMHPDLPDDVTLIAPLVTGVTPIHGATDVPRDTAVHITFDQPMSATTLAGAFSLTDGVTNVPGASSYDAGSYTFAFTPTNELDYGTRYTATLSTAAQSAQNEPLAADYSWHFTTEILLPVINEVDSDTPSTDTAEFIELYSDMGGVPLDGLVVVLFNGSDDLSYRAFDLDGYDTHASGYFVIGGVDVPGRDITVTTSNWLQNGPDAAAIYQGHATDFPTGTLVITTSLVDAIVYNTSGATDPELQVLLNPGQPQVNEAARGNVTLYSNQRCPNGSGGARNTNTYYQSAPTPGATNNCPPLVAGISPLNGMTGVPLSTPVVITFDKAISLSTFAYTVAPDPGGWAAAWSNGNTVVTLSHTPFAYQAIYTFTITAAQDLEGNSLANAPYAWSFTTELAPAALTMTKTVETLHNPVHLGDPITYTIVVANSGGVDAVGVAVTDTLPAGVSGAGLNWTGTVTHGQQVLFTLAGTVTTDTAYYGRTITNTAYLSYISGNGSDDAVFTIASPTLLPDLSHSVKVSNPSGQQVMPGDLVTYTITLSNTGDADASVLITDVLGSYYTVYDAMDLTESPAGTLTWHGSVPAGESIEIQFVAQVAGLSGLAIGRTDLDNTAAVNDGVHASFDVADPTPPWVQIHSTYLPLVMRASQ